MINRSTTFVLGAGAHAPYGFPLGHRLMSNIVASLEGVGQNSWSQQLLCLPQIVSLRLQPNTLKEFAGALKMAGQLSIDAFLEANGHRRGFAEIGKACIAMSLMPLEFRSSLFAPSDPNEDWLSYLFAEMVSQCANLEAFVKNNHVSFVTFNYDRSIEHFLTVRLMASFGWPAEVVSEALKAIPIVHVYGSLGPYNYDQAKPLDTIPLGQLQTAISSLKLIHEADAETHELNSARSLIQSAEALIILGFGFHPENVKRIGLVESRRPKTGRLNEATRFGVTGAEWERMRRCMPDIQFETHGHGSSCKTLLRNTSAWS